MKIRSIILAGLILCASVAAKAQIVSSNLFLQGRYTEIGAQGNGSLGSGVAAPSTYHPRNSGTPFLCSTSSPNLLSMVYDFGLDGWTVGTPNYMGDYTLPGSPWEGWAIEVAGTTSYAFSTSCGFTGGSLSGNFTTYANVGGRATGMWTGSAAGGSLLISKEYRVDTLGSALVVTVVLKNNSSTPINSVYYLRSCDPDQPVAWGGSFTTNNRVLYQNDSKHRVLVTAIATGSAASTGTPPQPISLGTKDCRAIGIIYNSWPFSTSCTLASMWASAVSATGTGSGASSCSGTVYSDPNSVHTGDIAIGLLYNLCGIPPRDSVTFSYAYIFNGYGGPGGVDAAFPEPQLYVNGSYYDSAATITACAGAISDTLPIKITYATDKNWKWSTWTWSPGTGLTATSGDSSSCIIHTLPGTITYTITGSDTTRGNCACNSKTFYLTIVPTTFSAPGVTDVYYCQGATPAALTATGSSLLWYTTATGGVSSSTAPTPSTVTPGVYTWYVSQAPCGPTYESPRSRIRVFVTANPIVDATNNTPVCAGSPFTLFASDTATTGLHTYSWTGPSGFTSTSRNPYFPTSSVADSGLYVVVLTVNGCTSPPDTTLAIVHATPPPPTVSNVTYCQYLSTVPLTATGTNILWYGTAATGGTASPVAPTPSSAVAGTFSYYVTQTVNGCESPRARIIVTINPKPAPPAVPVPVLCQYDVAAPLSATGSSLTWYSPGGGVSTTAPTPSTATPGVDTYYVTQTVSGCVSDRAALIFTVTAKPNPPVVRDTTYCQYASSAALTAVGSNLKWYTVAVGGTALASVPVPSTNTVGTTTWYVSQTVNSCESDRAPIAVTILYLPDFDIRASRNFACQFDTLSLYYNGPSMTDAGFHWVLPMGATYYSGDSSTSSIIVKFDSLRFQDVMLTASDYNGKCATIDTKRIKVVYQPTADAYIKEDICAGDTIVLALSGRSDNADHFTWSFDGASIVTANSNTGGPYKVFWPTAGAKVVTIQPFSMEGCKGEITLDTVKVHEIPDAVIAGIETRGTGTLCLEDSVMLKARTEKQEWNYTWTPAHFFNASNKGHIWGKIETRGYVILTVKDAFGCVGADSLLLNPESCCTVKFPTAFSPNNDGKNDAFRPVFDGYHRFHAFRVMNRWGQTVFESTNSKMEWDGTFNGTPQDLGVYYYYIKFDCEDGKGSKEHEQSGEVTLLR